MGVSGGVFTSGVRPPLTALPGEVIVVAVVNLVGILPDTDIECLVVVSPGSVVDPGFTKEGA